MKFLQAKESTGLIRQALKESFPGQTFAVRAKHYSSGYSVNVDWRDGPSDLQVRAVVEHFERYGKGKNGNREPVNFGMDGEEARLGPDYTFTKRSLSDEVAHSIVDQFYDDHALGYALEGLQRSDIRLIDNRICQIAGNPRDLQSESYVALLNSALRNYTSFPVPENSKTMTRCVRFGAEGDPTTEMRKTQWRLQQTLVTADVEDKEGDGALRLASQPDVNHDSPTQTADADTDADSDGWAAIRARRARGGGRSRC